MTDKLDTLVSGGLVVLPGQDPRPLQVGISGGRVVGHFEPGSEPPAKAQIDAKGRVVMPGVVDPHVHFGLGDGVRDWTSESRSAAVGGVTTVFSYLIAGESYLGVIPEALREAGSRSVIDYGLHTVPCTQQHLDELDQYVSRYGVKSFKYFMSFRGDEGAYLGVEGTDDGFLYSYFQHVARHAGAVACVHAENIEIAWALRRQLKLEGRDDLLAWGESRPPFVEAESVVRALFLAAAAGCPLYLVHISTAVALEEVRAWRRRRPDTITYIETCPHFLTHEADNSLGSLGKINPPLRARADIEALWDGIADGTIDTVGSDHVARTRDRKTGNVWDASAGFPGTGLILPILISEGHLKRGIPLGRIVQVASSNPARIFGCYPKKGTLDVGADADLVVVDLEQSMPTAPAALLSNADYNLYENWTVIGRPVLTLSRGDTVMVDGNVTPEEGRGRYVQPLKPGVRVERNSK